MQETKLKFTYKMGDGLGEYPEDLELILEFSGDATFTQVVTAFKMFLRGAEYSEGLIEGLTYEDRD